MVGNRFVLSPSLLRWGRLLWPSRRNVAKNKIAGDLSPPLRGYNKTITHNSVGADVLDGPQKERNIHRRTARKNRFVSGRRGRRPLQSIITLQRRGTVMENRIVAGRRGRRPPTGW